MYVITSGRYTIEFNIMNMPQLSSKAQSYSVDINKKVILNLESNIISK